MTNEDKVCHKCGVVQIRYDSRRIDKSMVTILGNAVPGKTPAWRHRGDPDNHLSMRYSQKEKDLQYWGPCGPDRCLMHSMVQGTMDFHEFLAELTTRGYDLSTLEFTVRRK